MTTTRSTHQVPTNRRRGRGVAGVGLAALLTVGAAACGTSVSDQSAATSDGTVAVDTTTTDPSSSDSVAVEATAVSVLSDEERAGLLYMVDEEKLAHDVYVTLGEVWGLQTFDEHLGVRVDAHGPGPGAARPLRDRRPDHRPRGR